MSKLRPFSSIEAQINQEENYQIKDITRASSAAPTSFLAAEIENFARTPTRFVDAGLTVNNPSQYAYEEAKKLFLNGPQVTLVSITFIRTNILMPFIDYLTPNLGF